MITTGHFYKPSHVFAKRLLDIAGALFGLLICGLVVSFLVPFNHQNGGPTLAVQTSRKERTVFSFYKFRSMRVDAEEIKDLMAQRGRWTIWNGK